VPTDTLNVLSDVRLRVDAPEGTRFVEISKPLFTIGRRSSSDLYLRTGDVSRDHAEIVRDGDRYTLRDRGSRFGTFVNDERVTEHLLKIGDRIRLGSGSAGDLVFETGQMDVPSLVDSTPELTDLRQMAAIMNVLRALGSRRVLDDVLTLVIDSALEATKAERGFIMLANAAGELEFKTARKRGQGALDGAQFNTSSKIPREVFETGTRQIVHDLMDGGHSGGHDATIFAGIRQVICVPLRAMAPGAAQEERPIGVLYLDGRDRSTMQSPATVDSLEAFATQAAIAIESTRLYAEAEEKARIDRDLRMAAEIQRLLLAEPAYSGAACELAAVSIPCRTIGGDFFDYIVFDDDRLTFALGDVAGKGPPAALLAVALQSNFVAHASVSSDPAQTNDSINQALLRRPIEARFATMFQGVLTRDGRLSYSNAGQEPPLVIGAGGVRSLEVGGPVLGLLSIARYTSETIQLSPGDLIVICSDGVTEAMNVNGEEFGRARVLEVLSQCGDLRPEAVLDMLVGAVRAFSEGAPQSDDLTAMILKYRP
jgi:phosphoserine phosphatase RsbU/P